MAELRVNVTAKNGKLMAVGNHGKRPFVCAVDCPDAPEGPVDLSNPSDKVKIGLEALSQKISSQVQLKKDLDLVRDTVTRSRLGDQVATALIFECRKAAHAGSKRARYMHAMVLDYIKRNPVKQTRFWQKWFSKKTPAVAGEQVDNPATALQKAVCHGELCSAAIVAWVPCLDPRIAAVIIANGPDLCAEDFRAVVLACPEEIRDDVRAGIRRQSGNKIGLAMRDALRLQAFRGGGPIEKFSPRIAWEHGY